MAKFKAQETYTDPELLELYRQAMAKISIGEEYTIGGRTLKSADLQAVRETIDWLEQRIQASSTTGSNTALARFGRPR